MSKANKIFYSSLIEIGEMRLQAQKWRIPEGLGNAIFWDWDANRLLGMFHVNNSDKAAIYALIPAASFLNTF